MVELQKTHGQKLALNHINKALELYETLPLSHRDIIIGWKKVIKQIGVNMEPPEYESLFGLQIGFPTGLFSYLYRIRTLETYIQEEEIKPIQLNMKYLEGYVEESDIQFVDQPEQPIILLETPLLERAYCISGKGSIIHAYLQNKQKAKVYCLSESEHLKLMDDPLSQAVYGFHRDLQILISTHHINTELLFLNNLEIIPQ